MDLSHLDFDRDGAMVLRGAFDPAGMVETMWGVLARRYRIRREDATTWPVGWFGKLTKFGKSGPFAGIATPAVNEAVTGIFNDEWHERDRWGQPLITFPTPGPWEIPSDAWHVDFPPMSPTPAVRLFAYLSPVLPGGGGTLIIAGSHRLVQREPAGTKSSKVRERLAARSMWLRDLWRPVPGEDRVGRYMEGGCELDGVHLQVVELTGEPGDVVLWHPALFHGIAPNCRSEPRFMLTHTAYRGPRA